MFNVWSALAERYNRRLDEDDIVDIRTGEMIKDRGVLSELPKRYNFGDLADKDDDPAVNVDPGSEGAEGAAEDGDEEDEEDGDGTEETDAFPSSDGLVAPKIARLTPLRPATSCSDADDLSNFLKAEAIRRELDGGDESSEDEFTIPLPRSTPARRTPLVARAKSRRPKTPNTESEDEFSVLDVDPSEAYRGYRARRAPSPEIPDPIPSPPPPSSSPGLSTLLSLPSSPLLSRTPLNSNRGPQIEERLGSPTPKRQPVASTSRRTLEDCLREIDLEFPPPQPRVPSVYARRPDSSFIIDLTLGEDEAEDERSHPTVKAMEDPESPTLESKVAEKNGSSSTSTRPIPYVLIETKRRPALLTRAVVAPESTSSTTFPDPVTPLKKGRPRAKSLKDKPPDIGSSQGSKRGGGSKANPVKQKLPTRLTPSDDERGSSSEPSPARQMNSSKLNPGTRAQATTPTSDSKPKSTRKSAMKPKSTKSTRSVGFGTSTTITTVKLGAQREPPEALAGAGDGIRSSPSLPPSPSPAPPTQPRIRGILKRKRRISSGPSSGEEQGSPKGNSTKETSPPDSNRIQASTMRTPEVISGDGCGHDIDPEAGMLLYSFSSWRWLSCGSTLAGGSKPQTPSQPLSGTSAVDEHTLAHTTTIPVMSSSSNELRENETQNHPGGSYTHFPTPPPLPTGFSNQSHLPFTPYSGYRPFQDYALNFNPSPHPNYTHNQYVHGPYPLFQDPNTQALLAQAVTQLAVLVNGGGIQPQVTHTGGITGNVPTMGGFPGSPGWGLYSAWPPSTPTGSRYPHGHDPHPQSLRNPHMAYNRTGGGVCSPVPPSTPFPSSSTFPSSLSAPRSTLGVRESRTAQEDTSRARSRSKSKLRVAFALDPCSGDGTGGRTSDLTETPKRSIDGSPPMTQGKSRNRGAERRVVARPKGGGKGKSKADESDQGLEPQLDGDDSGNEGSVDRHLPPKNRSEVRGRTPGLGRG